MITQLSHQRLRPGMATRKAGARPGRLATVLAVVIAGLLASVAAATAAFAQPIPVGDGGTTLLAPGAASTVRVISTGGMAGWQIALIAVGAALVAAAAAVLLDRKLAGRRGAPATTA
jgi:ABC-type Co2+ transport system permease subunit